MNIFITGATGFIGKHLLPALLARLPEDAAVHVLARSPFNHDDPRVTPLTGTLEGLADHERELLSATHVFHLGGIATFGDDTDYAGVNLEPTRTLARILAKSDNLENCIFTSTIGAFDRDKGDPCTAPIGPESRPNPRSAYGASKLDAENALLESGIPCTVIRPAWVYGTGMRAASHLQVFIRMILEGSPVARLALPGRVTLIHVTDLAEALASCLDRPEAAGKQFFAGTETLPLSEIFSILAKEIHGKESFRLPFPRLGFLMRRIHHRIPLSVANLFLDYLTCVTTPFTDAFNISAPRLLRDHARELVSDNDHFAMKWLITGANSGIGYELARQLREQGAGLILADRETGNLGGFDCPVIQADLATIAGIDALASAAQGERLTCLVNNAGLGFKGAVEELSDEQITTIVDVNIVAPMLLTKRLLPQMRADGTTIVNMASSVSYNPLPGMSVYAASKSFVAHWSEALTYELGATNHVVTVSPAGTMTNFQKSSNVKVQNQGKGLLKPEYVAGRIIEAVRKKQTLVHIGLPSRVLLTVCKFLPRRLNILIWGKLFGAVR